jgi:hypothetical protein
MNDQRFGGGMKLGSFLDGKPKGAGLTTAVCQSAIVVWSSALDSECMGAAAMTDMTTRCGPGARCSIFAPYANLTSPLAPFGHAFGGLSRWYISVPALKNGTDFCLTVTAAPVVGLRPP